MKNISIVFISFLMAAMSMSTPVFAEVSEADLAKGKQLSFERKKGNCLACHMIKDGTLAGNGGPPLIAMKARFPDKTILRQQIYDAREKNPNSLMPPFGAHEILTEQELDLVLDFIYSL